MKKLILLFLLLLGCASLDAGKQQTSTVETDSSDTSSNTTTTTSDTLGTSTNSSGQTGTGFPTGPSFKFGKNHSNSEYAGSGNGNVFDLSCPNGMAMVGVYGYFGDTLGTLGIYCNTFKAGEMTNYEVQVPRVGSSGNSSFDYVCPSNSVIQGIAGKFREGEAICNMSVWCRQIEKREIINEPNFPHSVPFGKECGFNLLSKPKEYGIQCLGQSIGIGFSGKEDPDIRLLQLKCQNIVYE